MECRRVRGKGREGEGKGEGEGKTGREESKEKTGEGRETGPETERQSRGERGRGGGREEGPGGRREQVPVEELPAAFLESWMGRQTGLGFPGIDYFSPSSSPANERAGLFVLGISTPKETGRGTAFQKAVAK